MKNRYFVLLSLVFVFFLLMMQSVQAFMPNTHKLVLDESLKSNLGSKFYEDCMAFPDLCFAGDILADVSVIFYYTGRGKYVTTHVPSFCKKMLENVARVPGSDPNEMRACAIGACLHQPTDIVSHSEIGNMPGMVSYAISHSFLANSVIHVFAEQHLDNWVTSQSQYSEQESKTILSDSYRKCQPLFVLTMLGESSYNGMGQVDLNNIFDTFVAEITSGTTGYDPAFEKKSPFVTLKSVPTIILALYFLIMAYFALISDLLIVRIFRRDFRTRNFIALIIFLPIFLIMAYLIIGTMQGSAFNTFINIIKPISNLVPIGNPETWINLATDSTKDLLKNDEQWLVGKDASGLGTNPVLDEASASILTYDYIILGILILGFVVFTWYLFKKNKIKGGTDFEF